LVSRLVNTRFLFALLVSCSPVAVLTAQTVAKTAPAVEWTPLVEFNGDLFPAYVLATSTLESWEGTPRMVDSLRSAAHEIYVGDILGFVGASVTLPDSGHVKVEVEAPAIAEGTSEIDADIGPNETAEMFPRILYSYETLAAVTQPKAVNALVRVSVNGKVVGQKAIVIRMRSANDIPLRVRMRDGSWLDQSWMFAAMVNENSPVIDQILQRALQVGAIRSFDGYQGPAAGVHRQVYAIWDVFQRLGFRYSSVTTPSALGSGARSQSVRSPEETVRATQANCVDGTVLFASVLRKIGIDPILVLKPGHMYLGYYLDAQHKDKSFLETTLLGSVDLNKYAEDGTVLGAVATQLGSSRNQVSWKTFVYANQVAIDDWNNDTRLKLGTPGYEAIDVAQQRAKGIMPVK
jgi:hypothetical protein